MLLFEQRCVVYNEVGSAGIGEVSPSLSRAASSGLPVVFDINLDCHAALALPRRGFLSQHPLPDPTRASPLHHLSRVDSVRSKEQSRNKKNGRV